MKRIYVVTQDGSWVTVEAGLVLKTLRMDTAEHATNADGERLNPYKIEVVLKLGDSIVSSQRVNGDSTAQIVENAKKREYPIKAEFAKAIDEAEKLMSSGMSTVIEWAETKYSVRRLSLI